MRKQRLTKQLLDYMEANTTVISNDAALHQHFDSDTRILCATNDLVDKFNLLQLQRHHGDTEVVTTTALHEFKRCYGLTAADQDKAIHRMDHTSDLRSSMPLAVGCPVTVTRNIMPQKRLYNGTSGTVTSITADIVHVQFKHLPTPVPIRRHQAAYSLPGGGVLLRKMFPLKCAYAQTVHNVQGSTISGRLVIHLEGFAGRQGLAYVACSRATCAANVTFILPPHTSKLQPDFFTPHVPPC
jgi:ATP-dependent exoDNAse (exonuclease V) alpha subunit